MRKTIVFLAVPAARETVFAEEPKSVEGRLVGGNGMSLHTFDKDTVSGKRSCTDGRATAWPAAVADPQDTPSGDWTLLPSADGKQR